MDRDRQRRSRPIPLLTLSALACLVPSLALGRAITTESPRNANVFSAPSLWHVVDSATVFSQRPAIIGGARSLWCGKYDPCWVDSVGYPNFAYEVLYIDTGSHTDDYTLTLRMNASTELLYDYIYLVGGGGGSIDPIGGDSDLLRSVIVTGSSGNIRRLVTWTGTILSTTPGAGDINTATGEKSIVGSNSGQPSTFPVSIIIPGGHRALYFVLVTDCLFSTEDGIWPYGTGVLLDDLATRDNGNLYSDAVAAGGTDAYGGSVIVGTGLAPVISSRGAPQSQGPFLTAPPNQSASEGGMVILTANASDPDAGDTIHMSAFGYPPGLTLTSSNGNPASATVSGTLPCGAAAAGPYNIIWCAASPFIDVNATTILTVVPDPHAPVVSAPTSLTRSVGSIVSIYVFASDPEGDAISSLTADLSALPAGNNAVFSSSPGHQSGSFTWTLVSGNEGDYEVKFIASNTLSGCATTLIHVVSAGSGVSLKDQVPSAPGLDQNRPNPFNPATRIRFDVPAETHAVLEVFDVQGRRVARLLDRTVSAGPHDVSWDGRDAEGHDASTGVYLYRLKAAGATLNRRMVLLR